MPRALTDWLRRPPSTRGIHFAASTGDWDFWPYDRLAALTRRTAAALASAGVREGDVVAVLDHATPQFVASFFGALMAGATPSPLPPPLTFQDPGEYETHIAAQLARARATAVLAPTGLRERVAAAAATAGAALVADAGELAAGSPDAPPRRRPPELALIQFTSGTGGRARGVRVGRGALETNLDAIRRWLAMAPGDATASWLPVHHDMGLVGCLLTPVVDGSDVWLMTPESFLRRPLRYLRCFGEGRATLTAMPCFGLSYIVDHVPPAALEGLDLRAWRAIIVGAERVDAGVLERFAEHLAVAGLRRRALLPAYGLAEATLAVAGLALDEDWRSLTVDPRSLGLGATARLDGRRGRAALVGCGSALAPATISIEDEDGAALPEQVVGEIVVHGPSVAAGYVGDGAGPPAGAGGPLRTGDAGFLWHGELYVLGRLGDGIKVRGRQVFAEEIEAALTTGGVPPRRAAALLGHRGGQATAVALLEGAEAGWLALTERTLRRHAEGASIVVVSAPRGTIRRTPSGKPRRRELWAAFLEGRLPGTVLVQRPAPRDQRGVHV